MILGVDFTSSKLRIICLEEELVPLPAGASRPTSLALFAEIKYFDSERRGCLVMSATCMRINLDSES